ncbi:serine-protein kinase RsbW [Planctomycetes bacterium Pan216]|uniref:Serine-protein kinase RsbW n=1 Tax=Kolteria novifilia TaxID=2527975 RepID=A0A518AZB3_9BACT|nr:serine-protein kinase RsbW [Planctomycetes bacterium Pan216]
MDRPEYLSSVRIPSKPSVASKFIEELVESLKQSQYSSRVIFGIRLAVEEALVNAVRHGNDCKEDLEVDIRYTVGDDEFVIEVKDQGPGFNPDDVPDPTAPENLERPCGRGILLMRTYMTDCQFVPPGNVCQMRRIRE